MVNANYQRTGPQLLPIIAEYADVDAIRILSSSHPMRVSYDLGANSIATNREVLQQRRDYDEKLSEAFEELIAIAIAEAAESRSVDSLMETGLFLSARSSFHSELAEAMAQLDSASVSPTNSDDRVYDFDDVEESLIPG